MRAASLGEEEMDAEAEDEFTNMIQSTRLHYSTRQERIDGTINIA